MIKIHGNIGEFIEEIYEKSTTWQILTSFTSFKEITINYWKNEKYLVHNCVLEDLLNAFDFYRISSAMSFTEITVKRAFSMGRLISSTVRNKIIR